MSPEQKAEYIQQKEYEAEDRRNIRHDKLRSRKAACREAGLIWMIAGRGYTRNDMRRMEKDPTWFPKYAHLQDFGCVTGSEFQDMLRDAGLTRY